MKGRLRLTYAKSGVHQNVPALAKQASGFARGYLSFLAARLAHKPQHSTANHLTSIINRYINLNSLISSRRASSSGEADDKHTVQELGKSWNDATLFPQFRMQLCANIAHFRADVAGFICHFLESHIISLYLSWKVAISD